jgi:hypothetical protein
MPLRNAISSATPKSLIPFESCGVAGILVVADRGDSCLPSLPLGQDEFPGVGVGSRKRQNEPSVSAYLSAFA